MEDESYGGGNKKGKKSRSTISQVSSQKDNVRLTESDANYPKDIPKGSDHYERNWRYGLREVTDQGVRRICWTVASTRNLSSQLLIEKKVDSLKYLSALHLLVGLFPKTDKLGGLKELGHLKSFIEENGAILEEDCKCIDPLAEMKENIKGKGKKGKCKRKSKTPEVTPILCTHKHKPKQVFKVKELIVLTEFTEEQLIQLVDKAPVAITVAFHTEFAKFTGDGIYKGPEKDRRIPDFHMLLCTGYATFGGIHYWDVQNSAGLKWGNQGFGKIIRQASRQNGEPSLIHSVVYPVLLDDYEAEE